MADKLQQGVNVLTSFVDGESPSAAKMNSITAQLRNASQQLEAAVGDLHDQSYPYSSSTPARLSAAYGRMNEATAFTGASTRSLDIANLARLIGPASALNPQLLAGEQNPTENVPAGVYEFSLNYPPLDTAAVVFTKTASGEPFEVQQASKALMTAEGHYYIDEAGRVFCTLITDATDPGTVTYTMNADAMAGGPAILGGRFNVMPGPNQMSAGGTGCSVGAADAQGRRAVVLPVLSHAQMNEGRTDAVLTAADPNYGEQLLLPLVITESYTVGEVLPAGFLLLKNWTTGEVYDEAEYTYNGDTSVLIGVVDITTEVDRGDQFVIVTVGTDISTSIDDLRRKSRHSHDRAFGEPLVPAASITDWTAGPWGSKGSFTVSETEGNYAPQYLHRYGYDSSENTWNDQGAMRGSIIMGRTGMSPGSYLDSDGISYSIYFGALDGPRLYNNADTMILDSGGIELTATDSSASLISEGGDIYIRTTAGDVIVEGGVNIKNYAGDPYVTTAQDIENVGFTIAFSGGNADCFHSNFAVDSLMAGPNSSLYGVNELPLWSINENGSTSTSSDGTGHFGYATTEDTGVVDDDAWVVPAFQVVHFAQQNVAFEPEDEVGTGSPTWTQTTHWQMNINLPTYLFNSTVDNKGANAVIGMSVMVKSLDVGSRWHTLGGGRFGNQGENIGAWVDADSGSASGNAITIVIDAEGDAEQAFHKDRYQGADGSGDPASSIDVDVKVLLFVAGPALVTPSILS